MGQINKFASTRCPLFGKSTPLGLAPIERFDMHARLCLEGVDTSVDEGEGSTLRMGTSGSPLESDQDETELLSCYFESSGKNAYGMRMQVEKTSVSAGAPRVLTLRAVLSHSTGTGPQGANAVDARATLETGNTGISGEMHAMESQCRVDGESRVLQGTYAAHKFTNNFGASNTMPAATTFFLRFYDAGTVKTPFLFGLTGSTQGTDNMYSTAPSDKTGGKVNATLKINVAGTSYWIPLWDVKDGS